jgi:hypothetical protein
MIQSRQRAQVYSGMRSDIALKDRWVGGWNSPVGVLLRSTSAKLERNIGLYCTDTADLYVT